MGGREGRRARQPACRAYEFQRRDIGRVGRFWNARAMAQREGLKAVQMFEAVERGEIKALWVMATNPAVSLPRAGAVRDALRKLDLLVISGKRRQQRYRQCPARISGCRAAAWARRTAPSPIPERRISRQRPFLPLPGEAKPDWWMVTEGGAPHGLCRCFRVRFGGGTCSASMPRCRLSRITAHGISTSARWRA